MQTRIHQLSGISVSAGRVRRREAAAAYLRGDFERYVRLTQHEARRPSDEFRTVASS